MLNYRYHLGLESCFSSRSILGLIGVFDLVVDIRFGRWFDLVCLVLLRTELLQSAVIYSNRHRRHH